jgi:CRP-like cAMP-binding protein
VRETICGMVQIREFGDGETIYRAGDEPDGLFGVLEGQIRLTIYAPSGKLLLNAVAETGDWIGENSTLSCRPRLHDAISAGQTKVAHMSQGDAWRLINKDIDFVRALAILASRHQRGAITFASRTLTQPVSAQVAFSLLRIARNAPLQGSPAVLAMRQEDLANSIGVTRQTVSPVLRRLQARGVIRLGYGVIEVLDRAALEDEAQRFDS